MKLILKITLIGFAVLLFSCEKKYTDKNGNQFIEKGNELFIYPAKYEKTGKSYKVFIYNETKNDLSIVDNLKIKPNNFLVINLVDTSSIYLSNGVKFSLGDTSGLEVIDKRNQVSGLGGEFLEKYNVPNDAEWAFVIVPEGDGDGDGN